MKKIFTDKMPIDQVVGFHIDSSEYDIPHKHEYFEFSLTNQGSVLHVVNNKKYVVDKNQCILVAPEHIHRTKNNNEGGVYELLDIQVEKQTFKNVCEMMGDGVFEKVVANMPYCFYLNDFLIMKIQEYVGIAQLYDFRNSKRHMIMTSVLFFIVSELVRALFLVSRYNEANSHKAIKLFYEQLNDKENIDKSLVEICDQMPYSRSHIMRVFKKNGLEPPNKILIRHKMNYAANLLITTDLKVINICNEIGYGSVAYFNKIFKSIYKCTPRDYRKKYNVERQTINKN